MEEVKDAFEDFGRKHTAFNLHQAHDEYEKRPRDQDGRVLPTEATAFEFMHKHPSPVPVRTQTQLEEVNDMFVDVGRKYMSANLLNARGEYESRQRDDDGRVMTTEAASFELTPSSTTQYRVQTQMEEIKKTLGDDARKRMSSTLAKARNEYESRERDDGGRVVVTTGEAFAFANTSVAVQRGVAKRKERAIANFLADDEQGDGLLDIRFVEAGCHHLGLDVVTARRWFEEIEVGNEGTISVDDFLGKYEQQTTWLQKSVYGLDERGLTQAEASHRDMVDPNRRIMHARLAEESARYSSRARDELGRVKGTVGEAFRFEHTTQAIEKGVAKRIERAAARFHDMDANGDGVLDLGEVEAGCHLLGLDVMTARRWFSELDGSRSGTITMEEFLGRFEQKSTWLEKSVYAADERGLTQGEARAKDQEQNLRKNSHSTLAAARAEWLVRRRGLAGPGGDGPDTPASASSPMVTTPREFAFVASQEERAAGRLLRHPLPPPSEAETVSALMLERLDKDRREGLARHLEAESNAYHFRMKVRARIAAEKHAAVVAARKGGGGHHGSSGGDFRSASEPRASFRVT